MVIGPVYSPSNFGKSLRQRWIILCSPLPPSCHNHTCLILSNLSFVLATQLQRCTLLHHWLSSDSIIFSLIPAPSCSFPLITSIFSPSLSCRASSPCPSPGPLPPTAMTSGSTLTHPSARAQTNPSRVVLFHKDQKQLVSFHVSRFSPLPACAAHSVFLSVCLPACLVALQLCSGSCVLVCLSRALIVCMAEVLVNLRRSCRTLGFLHVCSQCRLMRLLHSSCSLTLCVQRRQSLAFVLFATIPLPNRIDSKLNFHLWAAHPHVKGSHDVF